jgi:hypothetical protein
MPSAHYDLSMTSYGLIGLFVIGHETVGLANTLMVELGLVTLGVGLSLAIALVRHLRQN